MRLTLTALAALIATPAFAHEGHHEAMTFAAQVQHFAGQPDHLLAAAGLMSLALAAGLAWRRAARVRA